MKGYNFNVRDTLNLLTKKSTIQLPEPCLDKLMKVEFSGN